MRIGVLADTHLAGGRLVPEEVIEALGRVDLILHAGDVLEMPVIEHLSGFAETYAVRGNMDYGETARLLPAKRVIEVGGFRIGLTHGHGPPSGMTQKVRREFGEVDCIVFGHTHNPVVEERDGIVFFNPGSPTDRMFARRNTVGVLEVGGSIVPVIIDLSGTGGGARDG